MESVWYVAYGSNIWFERFRCYLEGGRPAGGKRTYPGCRDPRAPRDRLSPELPGGMLFGGRSLVWTGGMAFYDAQAPSTVACAAYLLTMEQFADVAAQEIRHPPGSWTTDDVLRAVQTGRPLGTGLYEKVLEVGTHAGVPMFTITCGAPRDLTLTAPAPNYLWTIAAGLRETHGWDCHRIAAYLAAAPGAAGTWTAAQVAALVDRPSPADPVS